MDDANVGQFLSVFVGRALDKILWRVEHKCTINCQKKSGNQQSRATSDNDMKTHQKLSQTSLHKNKEVIVHCN